tara:strand:+ start:7529 stop:8353 length:825 start_codon:yes stop_codon:yes gene_type:complete
MRKIFLIFTAITVTFILISCKKDEAPISGCTEIAASNYNPDAIVDNGSCEFESILTTLTVNFTHTVDGNEFILDFSDGTETLQHTNNAGQKYNVKRLWYIISDIALHTGNGSTLIKDIHFIDLSDANTLSFMISDLEKNNYTGISYTMGLSENKNISNAYINDFFHSKMFWPETMGGGYHYMKMEGNFENDSSFYNIHTGGTMGGDYSIINNNEISLITSDTITDVTISINMEINNWYQNPNLITLSNNGIMGNTPIQIQMQQNGNDVFSTLIN